MGQAGQRDPQDHRQHPGHVRRLAGRHGQIPGGDRRSRIAGGPPHRHRLWISRLHCRMSALRAVSRPVLLPGNWLLCAETGRCSVLWRGSNFRDMKRQWRGAAESDGPRGSAWKVLTISKDDRLPLRRSPINDSTANPSHIASSPPARG